MFFLLPLVRNMVLTPVVEATAVWKLFRGFSVYEKHTLWCLHGRFAIYF